MIVIVPSSLQRKARWLEAASDTRIACQWAVCLQTKPCMSRRKHLMQSVLQQDAEPPGPGQHIVRAVGSRGSNIIEVEFPEGRTTLCLLPSKFHKKLWIKKGSFLVIEDAAEEVDTRVTGQILQVLYEEHVKQLKRMPGVWPPEFDKPAASMPAAAAAVGLTGLSISDAEEEEQQQGTGSSNAAVAQQAESAADQQQQHEGEGSEDKYSSDDSLPPIEQINNRKVIEYEVSESDSE